VSQLTFSALLVLGAPIFPVLLSAQTLQAGSRVRIWSATPLLEARITTVSGARGDTIFFRDYQSSAEFAVPKSALTRVDLSTRPGSSGLAAVFKSALVGGLLGVGIGAGYLIAEHERATDLLALPLGWVAGVVVGALVGSKVARKEVWQRVPDRWVERLVSSSLLRVSRARTAARRS
jgi:hypothetical protein